MTCVRCQASRARAPTRHAPSRRRAPTWPRSNSSRSVVRLPVRVHGGAGPARLRTGECARRCITTATTPVWKWTPSSTAGPGDGPRSRSSWVLAGSKTLRGRSSPSPNGALRGAGHSRSSPLPATGTSVRTAWASFRWVCLGRERVPCQHCPRLAVGARDLQDHARVGRVSSVKLSCVPWDGFLRPERH